MKTEIYNWDIEYDKNGNSIHCLTSPYVELFVFRLKQFLRNDQPTWVEAHDAELLGVNRRTWFDLREAKLAIERDYQEIIDGAREDGLVPDGD